MFDSSESGKEEKKIDWNSRIGKVKLQKRYGHRKKKIDALIASWNVFKFPSRYLYVWSKQFARSFHLQEKFIKSRTKFWKWNGLVAQTGNLHVEKKMICNATVIRGEKKIVQFLKYSTRITRGVYLLTFFFSFFFFFRDYYFPLRYRSSGDSSRV